MRQMTAPQSGHPAIKVLVFEEMTNRPLALWTWESGNFFKPRFYRQKRAAWNLPAAIRH
jgi:hypothetical protein